MNLNSQGLMRPEDIPFQDPNADMAMSRERNPKTDKKVYLIGAFILFSLMCLYFIVFVFNDFFILSKGLSTFQSCVMFAIDTVFIVVMIITAKRGVKRYWALYMLSPIIGIIGAYFLVTLYERIGIALANILPTALLIAAIIKLFSRDERTRKLPFIATYVTMFAYNFASSVFGNNTVILLFIVSIFTVCAVNIFMLLTMAFPNEKMSRKSQGRFLAVIILLAIVPSATIYGGAFSEVHSIKNTKNIIPTASEYELQADSNSEYTYIRMSVLQNPYYIYDPSQQIEVEGYSESGTFLSRQQLNESRGGDYLIVHSQAAYWRIKGATNYKVITTPILSDYNNTVLSSNTNDRFNFVSNRTFSSEVDGYYTVYSNNNFSLTTLYPEKSVSFFSENTTHKIYMSSQYKYIFESIDNDMISLNIAFNSPADGLTAESALQFDEYNASTIAITLAPNTPTYLRYICKEEYNHTAKFPQGLEGLSIEMDTKYRIDGDTVKFAPRKDKYENAMCTFILSAKSQTSLSINISRGYSYSFSQKNAADMLLSPQNLRFVKEKDVMFSSYNMHIKWDEVGNANGYIVKKYRGGNMLNTITVKSASVIFSEMKNFKGDYSFSVMAIGDDVNFFDSETVRSNVYTVSLQKLATPQNVLITQRMLTWDAVPNAAAYMVIRKPIGVGSYTSECSYEIEDFINGAVSFEVMACGDGFDYANSDKSASNTVTFEKIKVSTPYDLEITRNQISWKCDDSRAYIYEYTIIDSLTGRVIKSDRTDRLSAQYQLGFGEFYFTVKAKPENSNSYADSDAAASEVYSNPLPPLTGSITLSGEARYEGVLTAKYTGSISNVYFTWYVGGKVKSDSYGRYYAGSEDIGKEIYVTVAHTNYTGSLKSETLTIGKAIIAIPVFAPFVESVGANSITLTESSLLGYSGVTFLATDGEETFEQSNLTFLNLKPSTEYTVYFKLENPHYEYFESPKIKVTTDRIPQNIGTIEIDCEKTLNINSKLALAEDFTPQIKLVVWLRNGSVIEGQSLREYTITSSDSGCAISAIVVLNNGDIINSESVIVNEFSKKSVSAMPVVLKFVFAIVGICGIAAICYVYRKLIKRSIDNNAKES